MKLLITIPSFNSEKTLLKLLSEIKKQNYEILIIDDGSSDKTNKICLEQKVNLITHNRNRGLSAAMRSAFNYAHQHQYSHILTIDSDLQHDPSNINSFISACRNGDMVIGNRFHNLNYIPSAKIASNLFASCLVEELYQKFIPDVACGYRIYKIAAFSNCDFGNQYEFIYNILLYAVNKNLKIHYCETSAIYFPHELLTTKKQELMGLLNSVIKHQKNKKLEELHNLILDNKDFSTILSSINFHAYYLEKNQSYIIQCDLKEAFDKYKIE